MSWQESGNFERGTLAKKLTTTDKLYDSLHGCHSSGYSFTLFIHQYEMQYQEWIHWKNVFTESNRLKMYLVACMWEMLKYTTCISHFVL